MNVNCGHEMGRSAQPPLSARNDHLDSWKQIAVYLNREVRTAQRWEKYEGMPIHRHIHTRAGTVYASKKEIDVWLAGRGQTATDTELRPMQKYSKHAPNELNPPPQVTRQMLSAFGLLLAIVANESFQDSPDVSDPDVRTALGEPEVLPQKKQSDRKVRTRQLMAHRACRALSLAGPGGPDRFRKGPDF